MIKLLTLVLNELHPTRLIGRLQAVSPWKLGAVACVLGLFGGSVGLSLTWYTTHARQFCLSCHQYQRAEFGQAKLHPSRVLCADCHKEGHTLLPTRFAAEAKNVRVQCQQCHEQIITDAPPQGKSNPLKIRITHASHLKLDGVTCGTCHYNVAHDRREHPTNRPTMATCFKCHQGEQRACNLCHPAGSLKTPPPSTRLAPTACEECHLDWETDRHVAGGASFAHSAHLSAGLRCDRCHTARGAHGKLSLPEKQCWASCHQNRPASHGKDWPAQHAVAVKAGAQDCQQCHQAQFCTSCHGIQMPHPDDWRKAHPETASASASTCKQCHQQSFCQSCHSQSRPTSHDAKWRGTHGQAFRSDRQTCLSCHTQDFCARCHEPMPHPKNWTATRHAEAAQQDREGCNLCHDDKSCLACHDTPLPHGKQWSKQHGGVATKTPDLCAKCHASADCQTCHARLQPRGHEAETWKRGHAKAGQAQSQLCRLCHGKEACQSCHGVEMPHPQDWVLTHKAHGASLAPGAMCLKCHDRTRFCADCHPEE